MGLLGKLRNSFTNMKNGISQGIQSAKNFASKAWDATKQGISKVGKFVYNNREHIGNALQAASPFIGAINPALGLAASSGGSFLSNLKAGPMKNKLKSVAKSYASGSANSDEGGVRESSAQQAADLRKRKVKKGKLMSQL